MMIKVLYAVVIPLALLVLGCGHSTAPPTKIKVVMKRYAILPAEIRIKKGQLVEFDISTQDVQHGFTVPELGIKQPVQPGRPATFVYTAGRKGSFEIKCSILCGARHDQMRGRLIVE